MSGTIWLITEDETDAEVVERILEKRGLKVRVKRLGTRNVGGISRLAGQLARLIATAKAQKQANDCIAVLHDEDRHIQPDRTPYETIATLCKAEHVAFIIARDELEAWLLADSGVCAWLESNPANWDGKPKPKEELERRMKKKDKHLRYQGKGRQQIMNALNGDGDQHSPSMKTALAHLDNAPCMRT
jgi:hypothetical protein